MTSENSSEDAFLLWIREKTAENLTDKIESEVDNYGEITPQTWKIAAYNIFKKIKDMEETKRIVQNINGEIKNDIRTISRENTRQSKPKLLEERLAGAVLGQKQFQQVCRSLSYMKPLEIRIQALKCLIHSQLPDGVTKECWPFLKRNLQHCLNDQNVELFTLTLKFHIKIVSTAPHLFAKECLLNLIESLHLQYIKKSKYLPNFDIGLDLNDNGHKKLIRMAHVIIHIVKEITKNWVRFKDKWIEEIISAFLLLMTMHTTDVNTLKRCVFPIHLLSLLDPKATWCFHWLHSSLGRNIIFSMERKVLVLLKYVTEIILSSNADKHNYDINNKVSFTQLKEANFIHCLNIFINLISYKKGNNFFPIQTNVQIEPVSVPCILISLIEFVNNHPSKNSPAKEAVIDSIIKIMSKRNFIHSINKDILNALVKPLVSATNSLESIPPHTIHILCELCNYEWHLHNFLGFQSQLKASLIHFENVPEENKIEDDLIPVNTLTLYITKQLQNQDVIDIKSLSMLIQIFIRLLSISNKIVLDLFETSLISAAVCLFNRLYLNADDHANMWTLLEVVR